MTDSPLLLRIFRQDPDPLYNFYIHGFLFEYVDVDADDENIFYYDHSCDDFRMSFVSYMIDNTTNCDTSSNLDFVRFIWQNYERFNFVKYSLIIFRRDFPSLPELLCLKYYMRVRRMERQHKLRLVCREVSKHITSSVSMSPSQ
jgi:hypothetical protein